MKTQITNLSDLHTHTRMTPTQARAKANAELIVVVIPGDGEFYYATPDGYGCSGVSRGSWEAFEAECVAAGWIVEVVA
jgi:hypothetical protein